MSASLVFRNSDGDEVQISLHPISLVKLLAEVIDDAAQAHCRRKGHVDAKGNGYCERCGLSLPDTGGRFGSWLPDAYRTIRRAGESS